MADTTNVLSIKECSTMQDCARLPIFLNFGWEFLYKKNMLNMIKIIDAYNDICRLYVLAHINDPFRDADILFTTLFNSRIKQHPDALQLTCSLKDIMPDVDPVYLDLVGEMYAFDQNGLSEFIEEITTTKKTYPKLQEYNEKVQESKVIKSLRVNFRVDEFLRLCLDPITYFDSKKSNSEDLHYHESVTYLNNRFKSIHMGTLRTLLQAHNFNLTHTVQYLEANPNQKKNENTKKSLGHHCKPDEENFMTTNNLEFLKEMAYLDHKEDIVNFFKSEKFIRQMQIEEASTRGHLRTCECCFNDELLDSEVCFCPVGHYFCFSCIKSGMELAVGRCQLVFKCLSRCDQEFDLSTIKKCIDDKMYQRILRLKQAEEVKAASIEGLETCAFCDYSVILSPDIKIINCLNPKCKNKTCRECRKKSHFPLRCDQVEKDPEIKVRTMIENKMTEVLIRTCYNCQRNFIKETGCNKIICSCGKEMCYICRQPVDSNYRHFYLNRVIENRCPLYTDENIVHTTAVEAAARLIMNELKESQPELLSNIDINKILPDIKNINNNTLQNEASPVDVNKIVATLIGKSVIDVNNLKDMRKMEPSTPKRQRQDF